MMAPNRPYRFIWPYRFARLSQTGGAECGISLIESLIAYIAGVPVIIGLLTVLSNTLEAFRYTHRTANSVATVSAIKSLLTTVIEHLGEHRLPLGVRIHPIGALTFTDGSPHPMMHHPRFRPEPNSTAISALELDIEATLDRSHAPTTETIALCSRWGKPPSKDTTLFLGLSVDGAALTRGSLQKIPGPRPCFNASLLPISSTVLPPSTAHPTTLISFVPVVREYSVYLSLSGELRYLSHRGALTLENQPLLGGVKRLHLRSSGGSLPSPEPYLIHVTTSTNSSFTIPLYRTIIPRSGLLTFLGLRR